MTYHYQFYSHPALIFHYLLESIKPKYIQLNYMRNEGDKLYVVVIVKRILVSTLRVPFFRDRARGGTWSKK